MHKYFLNIKKTRKTNKDRKAKKKYMYTSAIEISCTLLSNKDNKGWMV